MMKQVSPRLRSPLRIIAAGAAAGAITVASRGWAPVPVIILVAVVVIAAVGYYVWGGRDSDMASSLRRDMDERQLFRRMRAQALVGKVMALASAVGYLVAVDVNVTLWPFAVALALPVLAFAVGWVLYGDRGTAS